MKTKLFDKSVLNSWEKVDPIGWKVIVNEILVVFFDMAPAQYEELQSAWKQNDLHKAGQLAHILKSSCGNVGAVEAQLLLDTIEKKINENQIQDLGDLFVRLEQLFPETRKYLEDFQKSNYAA